MVTTQYQELDATDELRTALVGLGRTIERVESGSSAQAPLVSDEDQKLYSSHVVDGLMTRGARVMALVGDGAWLSEVLERNGVDLNEVADAILELPFLLLTSAWSGVNPEELMIAGEELALHAEMLTA